MSDSYYNLGTYRRIITTTSPEAQLWFDRGLRWAYCFNFDEAVRCFEKAVSFDPECAMAYWGMAYAAGPNYNKAWHLFDQADLQRVIEYASRALEQASQLAASAPRIERDFIQALKTRFPSDVAPRDQDGFRELNIAYAESMRTVYARHEQDLDAGALFADALLCVSPRALWDIESGDPIGYGTVEARRVIEATTALPGGEIHPALPHLYIHLMEMSPFPESAMPAADRLRRLAPEATHTMHMATHIDHACGDWRRVIDSNRDAADVDDRYFAEDGREVGVYSVYRAHNLHTMAYGAMMAGRERDALEAAERMDKALPVEVLRVTSPPMADWAESYLTLRPHVLIRFGRWEDILDLELPEDPELYCSTTASILYAQGVAFAALGRVEEARATREKFRAAKAAVPSSRLSSLPVRQTDVLEVASAMLDGELEYRRGNFDDAWTRLRRAIELEDGLPYADPPAWVQPVRHAYGALLVEQGHLEEAAEVYRADLGLSPEVLPRRRARVNNVWSLHGLYECLVKLGRTDEASAFALQRSIAVASADIEIGASCFCRLTAFDEKDPICCSSTS
ncbi:tetratricopeptide repeat protein [Rhodococcus pyridinivorans]|uniref:tetratricopeptide repeat protein n=1 Tax=Rhodococcus pyridinivorans TaxID=103816 RepID=UPI0020786771|nr:tetratricopeptide repeat protein [Rhodococcus pyridinivorans]USI92951.1 tetratricopeptide repeat protein [Rhodococcus pyridinivorans]